MSTAPNSDHQHELLDSMLGRTEHKEPDERAALLHQLLDVMLVGGEVSYSRFGEQTPTIIVEIRRSGTVAVRGSRPGLVLSFEPGQLRIVE